MPLNCKIDDGLYSRMLDYMHTIMQTDLPGNAADISFYNDDFWLQDTVVIENIELRNGEWNIFLVFAHHRLPLKLIKRRIRNYACPKKAALTATYMRRLAAKDQRGTLQMNTTSFLINFS